jgi:hypothetical protein
MRLAPSRCLQVRIQAVSQAPIYMPRPQDVDTGRIALTTEILRLMFTRLSSQIPPFTGTYPHKPELWDCLYKAIQVYKTITGNTARRL